MVRARSLLVAAASIALLSCAWIVGLPDVPDAAYAGGDGDPCSAPNVPGAPSPNSSSPSDSVAFTVAVSKWQVGQSDGGPYYGFNLDGKCTCPGADSCQRADAACDDPNGVDDYARRFFDGVNTIAPDGGILTESAFNVALASATAGVLVDVSGYNGLPDDGSVTVTVYASHGLANSGTPKFDGTDVWTIDPTSSTGTFTTTHAYVANNVLVAKLDALHLLLGASAGPITVDLGSALITATIEMSGGIVTRLTGGIIGGRLDPAKFLPGLQGVPDPVFGGYLCGDADLTYQLIKKNVCANMDLTIDPAKAGGSCDGVSFGLGFDALPAKKGAVASPTTTTPCGPTWSDHC